MECQSQIYWKKKMRKYFIIMSAGMFVQHAGSNFYAIADSIKFKSCMCEQRLP